MARTVVAVFGTRAEAERAAEMLIDEGFDRADVDVHAGDWAESKTRDSGSWWDWLFGESDERATYLEGSRSGAVLSVTTVSAGAAERAHGLLEELADDVQVEEPQHATSVRMFAHVLEQPVEEQIRLREERVRAGGEWTADGTAIYGQHENDFRIHAATLGGGRPYAEYRDAYRAGCELAADPRYAGHEWSAVESDVRADWDRRRPGTWERFKDSLRYAWDRARGARRAA